MTVLVCCVIFFFYYYYWNRPSVITFARGRYVAFWNKAPMNVKSRRLCVTPWSPDPAAVDEPRLSESQSSTAEGLTHRQGAIKHSTSFKVPSPMHAQTMCHSKTTRECRSRKYISGNLLFFLLLVGNFWKVGWGWGGKNGWAWHILLSPIVWVKSNGIINAKPSWFH